MIDTDTHRHELFVGGRWLTPSTDATIAMISPFTEEQFGTVPESGPDDVDATDRKFNRMRPSMARVLGLETRSAKEG